MDNKRKYPFKITCPFAKEPRTVVVHNRRELEEAIKDTFANATDLKFEPVD